MADVERSIPPYQPRIPSEQEIDLARSLTQAADEWIAGRKDPADAAIPRFLVYFVEGGCIKVNKERELTIDLHRIDGKEPSRLMIAHQKINKTSAVGVSDETIASSGTEETDEFGEIRVTLPIVLMGERGTNSKGETGFVSWRNYDVLRDEDTTTLIKTALGI